MRKFILFMTAAAVSGALLSGCNKKDDLSYSSGTFRGEMTFNEIILVGGERIGENRSSETVDIMMNNINDSMNFRLNTSIHSVNQDFAYSNSNIYQYTNTAEKINDRFEVVDKGQALKYFGTRERKSPDSDTTRFYDISFSGNRL